MEAIFVGSGLQSYLVHKPLSVPLRPHLMHESNHALQFTRVLVCFECECDVQLILGRERNRSACNGSRKGEW